MTARPPRPRLLWVTYDFPPRQAAGAFRPVKLYKFLDKSQVDIEFLTSRAESFAGGEHMLDDVEPKPVVYRAGGTPVDRLFEGIKARLVKLGFARAGRRTLWERIGYRLVLPFAFPDKHVVWGLRSALRALWLHLRRPLSVIYTTSFPESAHLPGMLLHLFGVRWVADYRYGGPMWTTAMVFGRKSLWGERLALAFQAYVLRHADLVITQSDTLRENFIARFGLDASRVAALPNGYDEDGFHDFGSHAAPFARAAGELHLLHLGGDWFPDASQSANLDDLLTRLVAETGHKVVVHALGVDILGARQQTTAKAYHYQFHGAVPHAEALKYLAAVDAFILSMIAETAGHGSVAGWLPAKLWEYLRAGKSILLMGPQDDAWRYAEACGAVIYLGGAATPLHLPAAHVLAAIEAGARHPERAHDHEWGARALTFDALLKRVVNP
jgi:glycosyltransferase involved in cell wall biosynthesis